MSEWDQFKLASQSQNEWDQFAIAPPAPDGAGVAPTQDALKSIGPSLVRGAAGLLGAPGDFRDLMLNGAEYISKMYGGTSEGAAAVRPIAEKVLGVSPLTRGPTSEQLLSVIRPMTGDLYKAKTPIGKVVESAGEFIPGALAGPVGAGRSIFGGLARNATRYGVIPGVTGEVAGQGAEEVLGEGAKPYAKAAASILTGGALAMRDRPVVTPQQHVGNNVAPTFGIPLSRGQANRSFDDINFEQTAARGGYGQRSQQVAEDFFTQQRGATETARGNVGQNLDRFGANIVDNPQAAAELTSESVRAAERQARQGYKSQYDQAFSQPGEFNAAAFEGVGQRIKGRLSLGRDPVIIDDVTTPMASRAIQDVDNQISQLRVQNRADPFGQPNPENIVGINLQGVDQTRKRLIQFAQSAERGTADRRAVGRVISEFDNEVEGAIANGLFTGDDRVLDSIRQARQEYRQYRQTFRSQGAGDDVGRAMERITGRAGGEGATATEVARYLYGEARTGAQGTSVRLAQRLQQVLGADSPEWSGIRQGLWAHLTHATQGATDWGPQKVAQRISEFLNGSGRPMSHVLYTPQERQEMARFGTALREMVPPQGAVNWSNTATTLSRIASNSFDSLVGMLGYMNGGLAGLGAGLASRIGRNFVQGAYNDRRVMRSLYPQAYRAGTGEALGRTGIAGGVPAAQSLRD